MDEKINSATPPGLQIFCEVHDWPALADPLGRYTHAGGRLVALRIVGPVLQTIWTPD